MLLTGAEGGRNRERMAAGGRTALWWDMEGCPLPSSSDPYIVTAMASALLRRFSIINVHAGGGGRNPHDHFSAYEFLSQTETELDQMLINSGIRLQQAPPGNYSEIEKMMMADILLWAMDTPPPGNIVFVVGNVDLSYLFEKLRQRSYNVYLVSSSGILVPQGMLKAANDYMGWLSFLQSLENEIQQLHFTSAHGFCTVNDRTFSNAVIPNSLTCIHNRELEESHNRSVFSYSLENSFSLPYFSGGWNGTNSPSSNETGRSSVQPHPSFHGHYITTEKPKRAPLLPSSTEAPKRPPLLPSTLKKKNPQKIPSPSMKNAPKKTSGPLKEFKAWLRGVVNSDEYAENGYNISGIRKDFQKATGKILDEHPLGFLQIIDLVEECKDVAVLKVVKKSCHVIFPIVKPNKQNNPGSSPLWGNPNSKPKIETDPRQKQIASLDDFGKYIHQMVFAGQFSQGFLMSCLRKNFEVRTGKLLDVKHLGYQKLSELVASYSHLVSVNSSGSGPVQLFPAGFVSQAVPNNPICNTTREKTSMNIHYVGSNVLNAKAEVCSISSGGSGKGLAEIIAPKETISVEQVFYINSDDLLCATVEPGSELLPSMPVTSTKAKAESPYQEHGTKELLPSMPVTSTKAKAESPFQEHGTKSDSSNTSGGSQVSEWEKAESLFQEHGTKSDSSNTSGGSQVSEWEEGHSSASSCGDSDQIEADEMIKPILF